MYKQILTGVQTQLNTYASVNDDTVSQVIHQVISQYHEQERLSLSDRSRLFARTFNAIRRLDVIQELIDDDAITEIMVNGHEHIFIEKQGRVTRTDLRFESEDRLLEIIHRIVTSVNRTVNTSSPIVDARLSNGSRVSVVLPPVALNGPVLTIRKFRKEQFTLKDLITAGSVSLEAGDFIKSLVKAKANLFISGGTGSGKTTLLNVLSQQIEPDERVISIEDSAELQLGHLANWVRLETRNHNQEGVGQVSVKDLIRSALRMRPDRIIVGEIRGKEALDMLQAMNTGHDGSLSTGHANSVLDMLKRIETMVLSGVDFPLDSIRQQIASAIDVVIHIERQKDKSRKIVAIEAIEDVNKGEYGLVPIFKCHGHDHTLVRLNHRLPDKLKQKLETL